MFKGKGPNDEVAPGGMAAPLVAEVDGEPAGPPRMESSRS